MQGNGGALTRSSSAMTGDSPIGLWAPLGSAAASRAQGDHRPPGGGK